MRALAIICGILLLFPGLCFLGFGIAFTPSNGTRAFGLVELVIGGLIMWGAIALLRGRK
jgi:hypothetical protein